MQQAVIAGIRNLWSQGKCNRKDSTQFCRDSNQCVLPGVINLVVKIFSLSVHTVRGDSGALLPSPHFKAGLLRIYSKPLRSHKKQKHPSAN